MTRSQGSRAETPSHKRDTLPDPQADPALAARLRAAAAESSTRGPGPGGWDDLRALLAREQGVGAWMAARPTGVRRSFLFGVAIAMWALVVSFTPRADLGIMPAARLMIDVGVYGVAAGVLGSTALRPLFRAPRSPAATFTWVALAVAASVVIPSLPVAHVGHPASLEGGGAQLFARAMGCLVFGTLAAVPLLLAALAVQRRTSMRWAPELDVALLAGLVGQLGIYLHCPITAREHLALGHATVLLPFVLLVVAVWWAGRRRPALGAR